MVVEDGSAAVSVGADCRIRIADLRITVDPAPIYLLEIMSRSCRDHVEIDLVDAAGKLVACNRYEDPFHIQERTAGYTERVDQEFGMRLWNA